MCKCNSNFFETSENKNCPSCFILPVACGLFGISEDYVEKFLSLDARFVKNKTSTFFFKAMGQTMEPLIYEQDILIVDRSIEQIHKRVVVVNLNNEMLCKRIIKHDGKIILRSDNISFEDITIEEGVEISVFGVVIGIARDIV